MLFFGCLLVFCLVGPAAAPPGARDRAAPRSSLARPVPGGAARAARGHVDPAVRAGRGQAPRSPSRRRTRTRPSRTPPTSEPDRPGAATAEAAGEPRPPVVPAHPPYRAAVLPPGAPVTGVRLEGQAEGEQGGVHELRGARCRAGRRSGRGRWPRIGRPRRGVRRAPRRAGPATTTAARARRPRPGRTRPRPGRRTGSGCRGRRAGRRACACRSAASVGMSRRLLATRIAQASAPIGTGPASAAQEIAPAWVYVVPSTATRPKKTNTKTSPSPR